MIEQFFLDIMGKRYIINDLKIDDDGRVTYSVSSIETMTDNDYQVVDDFIKRFISESQQ